MQAPSSLQAFRTMNRLVWVPALHPRFPSYGRHVSCSPLFSYILHSTKPTKFGSGREPVQLVEDVVQLSCSLESHPVVRRICSLNLQTPLKPFLALQTVLCPRQRIEPRGVNFIPAAATNAVIALLHPC